MISAALFDYVYRLAYWEKVFRISSISGLVGKTEVILGSKITFNSIRELESFLEKVFGENNFIERVYIHYLEDSDRYKMVKNFFLTHGGDVFVGDEQIALSQSQKKSINKEVAHKVFFPLYIEQNKLK